MLADVARNILAFLKSNATKEGHTYWLYKGILCFNYSIKSIIRYTVKLIGITVIV
jgi:hypothetical protein